MGSFLSPLQTIFHGPLGPGVPAARNSWAHLPYPEIPHISLHGPYGNVESIVVSLPPEKLECLADLFLSLHLVEFESQVFAASIPGT